MVVHGSQRGDHGAWIDDGVDHRGDHGADRMSATRREGVTITRCVVAIVCIFIVCQTPALFNQIFYAFGDPSDRECGHFHFYYTKLSDVLVVLNSSCNFAVYCLFGPTFRRNFIKTVNQCCCRCQTSYKASVDSTNRTNSATARRRHTFNGQALAVPAVTGSRLAGEKNESADVFTVPPPTGLSEQFNAITVNFDDQNEPC